jgi:type I restriction enzyme S subunit
VSQANINASKLRDFLVPKPPLDEQRKIAAVLGKVQAAVAVEGDLVRVARELKQAALRQLFTRGVRGEPQKQTALGLVPESWVVVRLEECCSVLSSSMAYSELLGRADVAAADAVDCMAVKVSDMNLGGNEISFTTANLRKKIAITEAKRRTIPAETIVFPKRGAAIATNKKRMTTTWTTLDPNLIGVRPGDRLLPWFLFQWFQQFDLRTITEPGPTPQLNKKNLTPLLVPIPSEAEQREIAALLATLDAKIAHHEAKQTLLRELFRTLLHDLLTARRRVTTLDLPDHFADPTKMVPATP